jgi:hypothetical protein
MYRVLVSSFFLFIFVGCGLLDKDNHPDWTIFVYMASDNNLYDFALADIVEMQKGLYKNENVRIIVFLKHSSFYSDGSVEYLEIVPNNSNHLASRRLQRFTNVDSGSGETLLRFLNWGYSRYASRRNMLAIWSHSEGWVRSENETFGIGHDDEFRTSIGISNGEFRSVFERHNKKYDIILLDACITGSLEMVGELEGYADFVIASPAELNANGVPWTQILESWDSSKNPVDIGRNIIWHVGAAYRLGGVYNHSQYATSDRDVSMSLYSMNYFDELMESIKEFSYVFSDEAFIDSFVDIRNRVHYYRGLFQTNIDIDFVDFIDMVRNEIEVNVYQREVLDNLAQIIDNFIVDNVTLYFVISSLPIPVYKPNLISIMYPKYHETFIILYDNHWSNLRLSRSNWGDFLRYGY